MKRLLLTAMLLALLTGAAAAQECVLPDGGTGTLIFPPPCPSGYTGSGEIVDGLPPGEPIVRTVVLPPSALAPVEVPGGNLGGDIQTFETVMEMQLSGTGFLAGFERTLFIAVVCETHTAPRTPGDAVQSFDTEMVSMQGELFGDPDFDIISVSAGSAFGLPSPGHTTLTRLGPPGSDFQVDSFFDIEYRIEWQGAPGSVLEGMGGIDVSTDHMVMGEGTVATASSHWSALKALY